MRPVRVVLADGGSGRRADVLRLAHAAGLDVVAEAVDWPEIADLTAARSGDAVLVTGDPGFAAGAKILDGMVASVVMASDASSADGFAESGATAVVALDADPALLRASVQIAVGCARRTADARADADRMRDQLESRKVVERAKGLLMSKLGLTEEAAYKRMQRASQEENRKMREIAESILSAERLYGETDR